MAYAIKNGYMLIETTNKLILEAQSKGEDIYRVDANHAHRLVRDGITHSTYLYLDSDNRIRRARDSY